MRKVVYKATTKGKFGITGFNLVEWMEQVCQLFPGKDITITVQKRRKLRSVQQNRWYFGVCIPALIDGFKDAGYLMDRDEVHDFLKDKFLPKIEIVSPITGEVVKKAISTTTLTTSQAMDYYAQIQQFGSEFLGIYIPDPNEQTKLTFE